MPENTNQQCKKPAYEGMRAINYERAQGIIIHINTFAGYIEIETEFDSPSPNRLSPSSLETRKYCHTSYSNLGGDMQVMSYFSLKLVDMHSAAVY